MVNVRSTRMLLKNEWEFCNTSNTRVRLIGKRLDDYGRKFFENSQVKSEILKYFARRFIFLLAVGILDGVPAVSRSLPLILCRLFSSASFSEQALQIMLKILKRREILKISGRELT